MDEQELIAQMNRNQQLMQRIDKLFYAAGFLCVIINGAVTLYDVMGIPMYLGREDLSSKVYSLPYPSCWACRPPASVKNGLSMHLPYFSYVCCLL